MNLSLPDFLKRNKAADDQPAAKPMPQLTGDAKPASIGKVRIQLLVTAVLLLGLLAAFVFQLMSGYILRAMDQESDVVSKQVAMRVESMVDHYSKVTALLAKDPDIAYLLMVGNESALDAREESLRYVFPGAINVRLLAPGITDVDMNASPPLSHAALAQMRAAESGEAAPPVEVHLFNTPQQHINLSHRVVDPAGSGVVGHLMVSLSADVLQDVYSDLQGLNGYIELQQDGGKGRPVEVAGFGEKTLKQGEPDRVVRVDGSRWQVAWWPAATGLGALAGISTWVLGAFLAAALLMSALIIFLIRKIKNALRVDQVSMVTIMKDFRDGRVRRQYPSGLTEMHESVEFMTQLATSSKTPEGFVPAPREQDAEYQADKGEQEPVDELDTEDGRSIDEGVAADFGSAIRSDNLILEEGTPDMGNIEEEVDIDPSIFRAYDIRGVVEQTLTTQAVRLIGRAIGSEALQRGRDTVVVGRDGRLSGPSLSEALIAGITSTGCDVKDIGVVPTGVLYFATYYLDTQTGVVVTGSHNPPDYNGLKIVIDGETLSGPSIQSLYERIKDQNFISGEGGVETINVVPDYIERIRGDVTVSRPLKVVIDCGNGVAGAVAPQLFKGLGCEVIELFCEVDGNFPNHHPDPSKEENLQDLIAAVAANQADVGLAFDGDGDRLGVVNAAGDVIWPDRVLMLYAIDILTRNPGGQIIYDVKSTRNLDKVIRDHGGEPLMWKTGHSFIKAKIRESGALLAGEMSGHIFINERWYGFDDGLYAGARLLEVLAKDDRSSTEMFAALPDSVNTPEINIQMREGEPPAFMNQLLENAHFEGASVSTIDGLRADFDDGWGLVRSSNTTPVLVLRFEADNDEALARIMGDFRRVMLQVNTHLSLPF